MPVPFKHSVQMKKLEQAVARFEESPYNSYRGPEQPELLIITSSICHLYSQEAIHRLGVGSRVGVLKLGTTWPLPPKLVKKYMGPTEKILVVEEVLPLMEEDLKVLAQESVAELGQKKFYGHRDGSLPPVGELNPDLVEKAIAKILGVEYKTVSPEYENRARQAAAKDAPGRELTFCPGCPHRASFWAIKHALELDNRHGFVCGDIGCYVHGISILRV